MQLLRLCRDSEACRVSNVLTDVRSLKFFLYSRARARAHARLSEDSAATIRKQFEDSACVRASADPRHRACRNEWIKFVQEAPGGGECSPRGALKLR